jgi:8-oxo-dGTP pyrophosphatase MutT (NUDIX family)
VAITANMQAHKPAASCSLQPHNPTCDATQPPRPATMPAPSPASLVPVGGPGLGLHADGHLREALRQRLQAFEVHEAQASAMGLRHAAVVLAVTEAGHGAELPGLPRHLEWCSDAALLITRRASGLRRHAGQWALPGGRVDPGETAEEAALRELHEETGLLLPASALLGRLDDYVTRSGYRITPWVAWAGLAASMQANPAEVERIHRLPVQELLRADAPLLDTPGPGPHPVLRMPVGEHWIAAPTAALLYQFREVCILGRATRVDHFDQPAFAWQ